MRDEVASLYEKFRIPLLRFLRYRVHDEHLAEDLLHEVFIKAGRSLESLKEGEKIQSWLYAIAANTANDHFRKKRLPLTEEADAPAQEELEASVLGELSCCLKSFLDTLPAAQRGVLEAAYENEFTLVEYAEANGLSLSTVKSHARRGKQALRTLFDACCRFEVNERGEMVGFADRQACGKC